MIAIPNIEQDPFVRIIEVDEPEKRPNWFRRALGHVALKWSSRERVPSEPQQNKEAAQPEHTVISHRRTRKAARQRQATPLRRRYNEQLTPQMPRTDMAIAFNGMLRARLETAQQQPQEPEPLPDNVISFARHSTDRHTAIIPVYVAPHEYQDAA